MQYIVVILSILITLSGCQSTSSISPKPVIPPNGGAAVDVGSKGWQLSGINVAGMEGFDADYPEPEETKHIKVVNAGFILANSYGKRSQVIYQFNLGIKNLPQDKAFTRVILENPVTPSSPIVYEHYIESRERSASVIHGPLQNISLHHRYLLIFEIYADENRTVLIDRVEQFIVSPLDNTTGCVELSPDYKKVYLGGTKDPKGRVIPLDKLIIWCEK